MNKRELIKNLENTINRIPKDLLVWEKEIARLINKKDKKSLQIKWEYTYQWAFYRGKLMSYIFVMQELNKGLIRMLPTTQKYVAGIIKEPSLYKGMKPIKMEKV